jgi:hypothetical protein
MENTNAINHAALVLALAHADIPVDVESFLATVAYYRTKYELTGRTAGFTEALATAGVRTTYATRVIRAYRLATA